MSTRFAEALREAEEEQVLETCRKMCLDRDSATYVLAKHRRSSWLLEVILAMGGTIRDYVAMTVEARPPGLLQPRRRYR